MITLRITRTYLRRSFWSSLTRLNDVNKHDFYNEEVISKQPTMKQDKDVVNSLTFETNTPSSKRMDLQDIFGTVGKKQSVSSRMDLSYRAELRKVCGVEIPKKPIPPTNCCGSGCVNCVWVIFDDDMEDWKYATEEAVKCLNSQDTSLGKYEQWPLKFDPPPKGLDSKFIPDEYKQIQEDDKQTVENVMPVLFSVFTDFERKLKKKKQHPPTTDLSKEPASDFNRDTSTVS